MKEITEEALADALCEAVTGHNLMMAPEYQWEQWKAKAEKLQKILGVRIVTEKETAN